MTDNVRPEPHALPTETVALVDVKPHPRNYLDHPQFELEHIKESVQQNGIYRPLIVARDNTLLAGHGVRQALLQLGWTHAPAVRLDLDPEDPKALKVLTGDNEIGRMSQRDEKMLAELLKEVNAIDVVGLMGTGFDEAALASLLRNTGIEPTGPGFDPSAEWQGMPEFEQENARPHRSIIVHFETPEAVADFQRRIDQGFSGEAKFIYHPRQERRDLKAMSYESPT